MCHPKRVSSSFFFSLREVAAWFVVPHPGHTRLFVLFFFFFPPRLEYFFNKRVMPSHLLDLLLLLYQVVCGILARECLKNKKEKDKYLGVVKAE